MLPLFISPFSTSRLRIHSIPARCTRRINIKCVPKFTATSNDSKSIKKESSILKTHPKHVPSLFQKPEAVLGVVFITFTLFTDFIQNIFQLISISQNESKKQSTNPFSTLKQALTDGKNALIGIEKDLNNIDESLITDYQHTKDIIKFAREQTNMVEKKLEQFQSQSLYKDKDKTHFLFEISERDLQINRLQETIQQIKEQQDELIQNEREHQLKQVDQVIQQIKENKEREIEFLKERESDLIDKFEQIQSQLYETNLKYDQTIKQSDDLNKKLFQSQLDLDKTKHELEQTQFYLKKEEERNRYQLDEILKTSKNREETITERLEMQVTLMKNDLKDLESKLSDEKNMVNQVKLERNNITSLVAVRNAQLETITRQLESALAAERQPGGDETKSKLSLEMILQNLNAEKMALSSEIAQAEIALNDLVSEQVDELSRIDKQIQAEGGLLKAGLLKAQATVKMEEKEEDRKKHAVGDVLKSLNKNDNDIESLKDIENLPVAVSKQSQKRKSDTVDVKPKRKRGRPRKSETVENGKDTNTTKAIPKKRGRPRKSVEDKNS